jgi:peptidoglycan/LPS O-acetylase OafA/YrhL
VLLYAIAAALPLAIYEIGIQAWKYLPGTDPTWFTYLFPPVRSLEFWFGVVLGELVVRRVWYGPGLWLATAIGVALYAGNHWIAAPWWRADLTFAFGLLIAGGAKADLRGAWSPWRWRWMVWLGEVSFAFYLVHVVFMTNVLRALHRNGVGWSGSRALPVIVVFLSASIFLAWLLYQFVEKPMMRLLRPRGSKPAVSQLSAEEVAAAVPAHHHHPKPARPAAEPTPVDAPRGDVPARQHQPGPSRTGAAVAEDS